MPTIVTRGSASLKALGFAGAGKPLAPTIGTLTRTSASISVPFTANYNGGSPITGYTITSTPGNYTFTGTGSPITATGMTLGTSYTFTVRATNVYGDSPESISSDSIKYASVPPAPTIGTATVTSTTSVNVTFTAGANGGETITQYTAVALVGGIIHGESGTIYQAGSGTIPVTGLNTGSTYTFKVVASNAMGNGVNSLESNSATPDLPRYTINTDLLGNVSGDFVNEASSFTVSVITNETVTPTTIYWALSGTGITTSDFLGLSALNGSLAITANSTASFNLDVKADQLTEGQETAVLTFYTNAGRTIALSDSSISGYVTGSPRNIIIQDTSTTPAPTYSISANASSVNEGSSIGFTVTTANLGTGTAYWSVQGLSGTVNSSDLTMTGSVSISGDSGSFSISVTADQVTEGAETFRISLYSDSNRTNLVAVSGSVTINDTSLYPASGTYQGQFCSGYDLYYTYANGSGGSYNSLAQSNSPSCGYIAPTLTPTINGPYSDYTVFGPNYNTKSYYLLMYANQSDGLPQYWSVSGLTTQGGLGSGSSGTWNNANGTGAAVVFKPPHSATYVTVTVSRSGYTSYSANVLIPANNVQYSPYTYASGFVQEFGYNGYAALAADVATLYTSNNAYTLSSGQVKYGLYRRPDAGGLNYWVGQAIANGWTSSSQPLIDAILSSPESSTTQPTSFGYGTGYGDFSDRP